VVKNAVERYIRVDLKYKFQILTDIVWVMLNIIAFGLLGNIVSGVNVDMNGQSLRDFLLVGVLFWAFFDRAYTDTVETIPEEASRGTIGFLVTNNVSILTLLISRNISSTLKTFLYTLLVIPILYFVGVFHFSILSLPIIIGTFLLIWLFMITISIFISSFNIIFKRVTPFAQMLLYGLKIASGYYFPIQALDAYIPGISGLAFGLPVVSGLYFVRDVAISNNMEHMGEYLTSMIFGTIVMGVVAFVTYKMLEKKSQKWGTLEFY